MKNSAIFFYISLRNLKQSSLFIYPREWCIMKLISPHNIPVPRDCMFLILWWSTVLLMFFFCFLQKSFSSSTSKELFASIFFFQHLTMITVAVVLWPAALIAIQNEIVYSAWFDWLNIFDVDKNCGRISSAWDCEHFR